jgi:hypothetical protein
MLTTHRTLQRVLWLLFLASLNLGNVKELTACGCSAKDNQKYVGRTSYLVDTYNLVAASYNGADQTFDPFYVTEGGYDSYTYVYCDNQTIIPVSQKMPTKPSFHQQPGQTYVNVWWVTNHVERTDTQCSPYYAGRLNDSVLASVPDMGSVNPNTLSCI